MNNNFPTLGEQLTEAFPIEIVPEQYIVSVTLSIQMLKKGV